MQQEEANNEDELFLAEERRDLALIEAARVGDEDAIKELLLLCANAKAGDGSDTTALMHAARAGHDQAVELLLPWSDASAVDKFGYTAAQYAAQRGHAKCCQALRESARHKGRDGWTALHWAATEGHLDCVKILAPESDVNAVNKEGEDALIMAARAGEIECVRALSPHSTEKKSKDGKTALAIAASWGQIDCVALLSKNQDVNSRDLDGATPLINAAQMGAWDCALFLAPISDAKAQTTAGPYGQFGDDALMNAAWRASPQAVNALLPLSDPTAAFNNGRTALMAACSPLIQRTPEVVRQRIQCIELLARVSDLRQTNQKGQTAFDVACDSKEWAFVDALADQMPQKAITDFCGTTDIAKIAERFPRWAAKIEQEALARATKEHLAEKACEPVCGHSRKENSDHASERKNRL